MSEEEQKENRQQAAEAQDEELRRRLETVKERIAHAAERSGRRPEEIELVVVTKLHPVERLERLLALGHRALAENRVQEFVTKHEAIGDRAQWHFIGHLQRNKVAQVVGRAALIQSVDSVRLIEELEKRAAAQAVTQRILLEVNVGEEEQKTGAAASALPLMLNALAESPHLRAEGLMAMAPFSEDPEHARPYFRKLRDVMRSMPKSPHFMPRHLSMGMSGDFEAAIEEGSTMVRVGTAVMGERPYR